MATTHAYAMSIESKGSNAIIFGWPISRLMAKYTFTNNIWSTNATQTVSSTQFFEISGRAGWADQANKIMLIRVFLLLTCRARVHAFDFIVRSAAIFIQNQFQLKFNQKKLFIPFSMVLLFIWMFLHC